VLRKIFQNHFDTVPDEVISKKIMPYLDLNEASQLAQTSKRMNGLVQGAGVEYQVELVRPEPRMKLKGTYSQILAMLRPLQITYQKKEEELSALENSNTHQYKKALDNTPFSYDADFCLRPNRSNEIRNYDIDSLGLRFSFAVTSIAMPSVAVPISIKLGLGGGIMIGLATGIGIFMCGLYLSLFSGTAVRGTENKIKQILDEKPVLKTMKI
jgi:hypothetical protein